MPTDAEHRIAQTLLAAPGFLLARIDQIAGALYAGHGGCETLAQGELLLAIAALDGATQAEVGQAAGVDKSTVGFVVDRLALRALVSREGDPDDRRRVRLRLTDLGRAALPRSQEAFAQLQQQLTAPLDDGGRALVALLRAHAQDSVAPRWNPPLSLADAPSLLLRRTLQAAQARFQAGTAAHALTPRQLSLLFILAQLPQISQAAFSQLFGLDPSTCGVILRNLARRDLIVAVDAAPDRRSRPYRITPAGSTLFRTVRPLVDHGDDALFGPAPARAQLLDLLQRLVLELSGCLRFPGTILRLR